MYTCTSIYFIHLGRYTLPPWGEIKLCEVSKTNWCLNPPRPMVLLRTRGGLATGLEDALDDLVVMPSNSPVHIVTSAPYLGSPPGGTSGYTDALSLAQRCGSSLQP